MPRLIRKTTTLNDEPKLVRPYPLKKLVENSSCSSWKKVEESGEPAEYLLPLKVD